MQQFNDVFKCATTITLPKDDTNVALQPVPNNPYKWVYFAQKSHPRVYTGGSK